MIADCYCEDVITGYEKVVIAIDPAVTSKQSSDETGIIAVAKHLNHYYVLEDVSGRYTPDQWAEKALMLYDKYDSNCIVGEVNQGGDMLESILKNKRVGLPIKKVRATKGKYLRAEPIAALYEQKLVSHVTEFKELESQMTGYTPTSTFSPDRLDALVWGLTYFIDPKLKRPNITFL